MHEKYLCRRALQGVFIDDICREYLWTITGGGFCVRVLGVSMYDMDARRSPINELVVRESL